MTALFAASEIAPALRRSKRWVEYLLATIPPDGPKTIRGQLANAWRISSFPARVTALLDCRAEKLGFRNAEHLLSSPPGRFEPNDSDGKRVSVSEISEASIQIAHRRRSALSFAMRQIVEGGGYDKEALSHYRREFGNVSERHFQRLVAQTIVRDAGEQRFDDIAIYFDKVVTRKRPKSAPCASIVETKQERFLTDALAAVSDPSNPSLQEKSLIFNAACEVIAASGEGKARAAAIGRAVRHMQSSGAKFPANADSLRRSLLRYFSRWVAGGRTIDALEDRRAKRFKKSGRFRAVEPTDHDLNLLKGFALIHRGGRLDQAWQDVYHQLSEPLRVYYINGRQMPTRIRRLVGPDVERMKDIKKGERRHQLNGAHITRRWDDTKPGEWMQGDDVTLPVYFYLPTPDGRFALTRGQFLLMIDERTDFILGFSLLPTKTYGSLDIRSLITRVCATHGLPSRGFKFELSVWRSKILIGSAGSREEVDADKIAEAGLGRFGLVVEKTLLPRGKVIERTIGKLQDRCEGFPGYCGRNEIIEKEERFASLALDVKAGRVDPRGKFLSHEQLKVELGALVEGHNHRPQGGRLNGSSPAEAWVQASFSTGPRIRFDDRTHYFLASEIKRLKVGRNGISFRIGKRVFNYKGKCTFPDGSSGSTGGLVGEYIYAWFNPERPEILPCTKDLDGTELFLVERSYEIPAHDCPPDLLSREMRAISEHQAYSRDLFYIVRNALPSFAFRGNVANPASVELGESIESGTRLIDQRRKKAASIDRRVSYAAQKARVPAVAAHHSEEAAESLKELAELKEQISADMENSDL